MDDDKDIVARLRDCDGGYGFRGIVREAADEIERLRVIVQKCTRLARNAKNAISTLRAERDEARREICDRVSTTKYEPQFALMSALQYAEERDWDCFEEVK